MITDWAKAAIRGLPVSIGRSIWNWLAMPPAAIVAQRYNLIGTDTQNFDLVGTDNQNFPIIGTDDQNFPLAGS